MLEEVGDGPPRAGGDVGPGACRARHADLLERFALRDLGRLLEGAQDALMRNGVAAGDIDVAWVPGAWEIPLVAQEFAESGRYQAVICLGAVIRGETTHDQHIT